METKESVKENTGIDIREPKQYKVIMLNDDFTTMDFVVRILTEIFNKDRLSARALMLMVHKRGSASVGCYPYDIAMSKADKAMSMAKKEGFPFRMRVEEAK